MTVSRGTTLTREKNWDGINAGAEFSECDTYRYRLWRVWDDSRPYCLFVMLNPSTADEFANDPTVARCQKFAREWGWGGLHVCNLFAIRATDPQVMLKAADPVGQMNDHAIAEEAAHAGLVVCAWGNHGAHRGRAAHVVGMLADAGRVLHCLKVTGTGEPGHPLYLRGDLKPVEYRRA